MIDADVSHRERCARTSLGPGLSLNGWRAVWNSGKRMSVGAALSFSLSRRLQPAPGMSALRRACCQDRKDCAHVGGARGPRARGRAAHRRWRRPRCQGRRGVGSCAACNYCTPWRAVAYGAVGSQRSCGRQTRATRTWSSCLSPPAPTSRPKTTKGRAVQRPTAERRLML